MSELSSKNLFEVQIGGLVLKLRTSYDRETVDELVELVNERLNEALASTKSGSLQTAALLTALNFAEDNLLLKKQAQAELDLIHNKASRVLSLLESSEIPKSEMDH